jgi:hypothetical protein
MRNANVGLSRNRASISSEHESVQVTTMRWPLSRTILEGGRLLSKIVTLCSNVANMVEFEDGGFYEIPKNLYRSVRRKLLPKDLIPISKLKHKTLEVKVQKVCWQGCCRNRCCQMYPWEETKNLRQKFYASSFKARRETAYDVQSQPHTSPLRWTRFITLANVDVGVKAWYVIHGVSKSAYYMYKAAAVGGCVSGSHCNSGVVQPRPHTIKAQATL